MISRGSAGSALSIDGLRALLAQVARRHVLEEVPDVRFVEQIDSTNTALLDEPFVTKPRNPQALIAWHQLAGRGRRGRAWRSASGASLTFSLACERNVPARPLAGWSLAVGIAVAKALQPWTGALQLKWPNDLQRDQAKCGGILVEARRGHGEAGSVERVVTGVGLNLLPDEDRAAHVDQPITALFESESKMGDRGTSREALLAESIAALCAAWKAFEHAGIEAALAEWPAFDALAGREVTAGKGSGSGEPLRGRAVGIDAGGALLIDTGVRVVSVVAGDVSVRASTVTAGSEPLTGLKT